MTASTAPGRPVVWRWMRPRPRLATLSRPTRRQDSYLTHLLYSQTVIIMARTTTVGVSCESTFTAGGVKAPDARTKHRGRSTHTSAPAGNADHRQWTSVFGPRCWRTHLKRVHSET